MVPSLVPSLFLVRGPQTYGQVHLDQEFYRASCARKEHPSPLMISSYLLCVYDTSTNRAKSYHTTDITVFEPPPRTLKHEYLVLGGTIMIPKNRLLPYVGNCSRKESLGEQGGKGPRGNILCM